MGKITKLAIGIGVSWIAMTTFAPNAAANLGDRARDLWHEFHAPDCSRSPTECFARRKAELERHETVLQRKQVEATRQAASLSDRIESTKRLLAANQLKAERGRADYQLGAPTVYFLGVEYTRPEMRQQLELLYIEAEDFRTLIADLNTMRERFTIIKPELQTARLQTRNMVNQLPAQMQLAKAGLAHERLAESLDQLDLQVHANNSLIARQRDPLRGTETLMADAQRIASEATGFDAWLNQMPEEQGRENGVTIRNGSYRDGSYRSNSACSSIGCGAADQTSSYGGPRQPSFSSPSFASPQF